MRCADTVRHMERFRMALSCLSLARTRLITAPDTLGIMSPWGMTGSTCFVMSDPATFGAMKK